MAQVKILCLSGKQDKEIQIEITTESLFERHKLSDENLSQIIKKRLSHWNLWHKVQINMKAKKKSLIWLMEKIKCIWAATSSYVYVTSYSLEDWNTTKKGYTINRNNKHIMWGNNKSDLVNHW